MAKNVLNNLLSAQVIAVIAAGMLLEAPVQPEQERQEL